MDFEKISKWIFTLTEYLSLLLRIDSEFRSNCSANNVAWKFFRADESFLRLFCFYLVDRFHTSPQRTFHVCRDKTHIEHNSTFCHCVFSHCDDNSLSVCSFYDVKLLLLCFFFLDDVCSLFVLFQKLIIDSTFIFLCFFSNTNKSVLCTFIESVRISVRNEKLGKILFACLIIDQ